MEKTNLKLSQLIGTMREIASAGNRFVKGDAFHDVERIAREVEEIEDLDIEEEFKEGDWYWGLRKNGTDLSAFSASVENFVKEYPKEAVASYKIHYSSRRFSITLMKEYGNEFFD